jgi:hypothetical protein
MPHPPPSPPPPSANTEIMATPFPYLLVFLNSVWQEEDLIKGREGVGNNCNNVQSKSVFFTDTFRFDKCTSEESFAG